MRLQRKSGETDIQLAARINQVVFNAYYHCDFQGTSRLLEKIAALAFLDTFRLVGLLYPEHKCGFCHQSAYILARALNQSGIDAYPLALNGHVVTLVNVDGLSWLFDPDFGLGPFRYGEAIWAEVEPHYRSMLGKSSGLGSQEDLSEYAHAYTTAKDDHPYFSLAWLNRAEQQQRRAVAIAEKISYLVGALGAIVLTLDVVRRWMQSQGERQ